LTSANLIAEYRHQQGDLEDFWARRASRLRYEREACLFGRPVRFLTNDERLWTAVDLCCSQYSSAPPAWATPFTLQLVVHEAPALASPGPAPDDLADRIQYTADGNWLAMLLGGWGHCQVDLAGGRALAVVTPELAQRPDLFAQYVLNTTLTNLFQANGLGMLHATCLLRGEDALLLMAPHNSGKSTTALRLVLAGWQLLSDSQVYVPPPATHPQLQLMGFPVGRLKLREDMLDHFPQLRPWLTEEQVRGEAKHTLDLRRYQPELVQAEAVTPTAVVACLLERAENGRTRLRPADPAEVRQAVVSNSLHLHTEAVWLGNLAAIERLVEQARWHRLEIGLDGEGIVEAVEAL
jgi:hypothetical protein